MFLLESSSAASHCRARAAARLQSPQDDVNADNDAVEPQDDVNADNDAVEPQEDVNVDNDTVEPEDDANKNNSTVAPKDAADAHADAEDPSGDESSTNTAADRAAESVSIILLRRSRTLQTRVVLRQPPSTPPSPMPTRPDGTSALPSRWPPLYGPLNPTLTTCASMSECPTRQP